MSELKSLTMIRPESLAHADRLHERFEAAEPYQHLVIDHFLDEDFANKVHDEARSTIPNRDASNAITQSLKAACTDWNAFQPNTHRLITYLNSAEFMHWLGQVVGIAGLFGDPELEGGGIHQTRRGGFLKMHTDFNWHAGLQADRRVNLLLYLNKDWRPEYGGGLMLSNLAQDKSAEIEPIFNRMVLFNTNDLTLHGHPDPLLFPEDYPRTSIAMYYYSHGKPESERLRGKATTTRYLPRHKNDIGLGAGSLKARLGYLVRRYFRI